jgi:hypothetical protein
VPPPCSTRQRRRLTLSVRSVPRRLDSPGPRSTAPAREPSRPSTRATTRARHAREPALRRRAHRSRNLRDRGRPAADRGARRFVPARAPCGRRGSDERAAVAALNSSSAARSGLFHLSKGRTARPIVCETLRVFIVLVEQAAGRHRQDAGERGLMARHGARQPGDARPRERLPGAPGARRADTDGPAVRGGARAARARRVRAHHFAA